MPTLEDVRTRYPGAVGFKFGDGPELSAALVALVREGKKTATCGALGDYPGGDPETPVVGRHDVVLAWDGTPELVIQTVKVFTSRFDAVTEDFALAEGENETRDGWAADHRAYFERNGGWSADMMLLCERFRVVEDLRISD